MPYILKESREELDPAINQLIMKLRKGRWQAGQINYIVSRILWEWFRLHRSYATINSIVGVLGCISAEFLRRKAADYEDEKIHDNGDLKDDWYKV